MYRKIYDCDRATDDGFPIKYTLGPRDFDLKFTMLLLRRSGMDGSALGNRQLKAKSPRTWYSPSILKGMFCLEKSQELRVNHSKKRQMIATRCRSCSGRAD